jgi:protein TonB
MIAQSGVAKLIAGLAALGVHAAVLVALAEPEPVGLPGGGAAPEARLGTSFSDLVAGGALPSERPEAADRVTAERPDTSAARVEAERALPQREPLRPAVPAMARTASALETIRALEAEGPRPVETPPEVARPVQPDMLSALRPDTATLPAMPVDPAATVEGPGLAHVAPGAAVEAEADVSAAPVRSLRPASRPESVQRPPAASVSPPPPPATAAGNAPRPSTAGTPVGRAEAAATDSGTAAPQTGSGQAAVGTYPGQVMRCISRAGRPRVSARGTAVVSFRISGGGQVTGVALAASSGDAGLDRAAVQTIAGAGPCPAPPQGAQTAFSIRVQGR